MAKHSMEIDDWMWKRFQRQSGLTNPATYIRAFLAESLADDMMVHIEADAEQRAATPSTTVEPSVLSPLQQFAPDRGRSLVCNRWTLCDECQKGIEVGESAVIRTNARGAKEMFHIDHFRRQPACDDAAGPRP